MYAPLDIGYVSRKILRSDHVGLQEFNTLLQNVEYLILVGFQVHDGRIVLGHNTHLRLLIYQLIGD